MPRTTFETRTAQKLINDYVAYNKYEIKQHIDDPELVMIDGKLIHRNILWETMDTQKPVQNYGQVADVIRIAAFETHKRGIRIDALGNIKAFEPASKPDLSKPKKQTKKQKDKTMQTQENGHGDVSTLPGKIDLNKIFAELVGGVAAKATPEISEDLIRNIVKAELSNIAPREIVIKKGEEVRKLARQHSHFELVLKAAQSTVPLFLTGPTGSGKTLMCKSVADALGLPFYCLSCFPLMSPAKFEGYQDATGKFVESIPYKALKEGKGAVLVVDEIDNSSAGVMTGINALAANRMMTFPNGETVTANENFILVATANTKGTGATREYSGRQKLDAATLDRFAMIEIPYDSGFEASLVGIERESVKIDPEFGGTAKVEEWLKAVESARAHVAKSGLDLIISPRAAINGVKLLGSGIGKTWVTRLCIANRLEADRAAKLFSEIW